MNLNIGPIKEKKHRLAVRKAITGLKPIFIIVFWVLPILIYLPFHFKWFKSGPSIPKNIYNAVAKVSIGQSSGSAFLVSEEYLVTAAHVAVLAGENGSFRVDFERAYGTSSPSMATVAYLPKSYLKAKIINDYAVLKLNQPEKGITPLEISKDKGCDIGDRILVLGYPGPDYNFSATNGTIANNKVETNLMQLGVGAWPGSSGGPVIDDETQEVVGILVAGFEGQYKGKVYGTHINALIEDPDFSIKF